MRISILFIFITLCPGVFVFAQEPVFVQPNVESIGHVRAVCPDMRAGNARMVSTTDGEILHLDDPDLVLCYGDGVIVNHEGDYNVGQDPDNSTMAGIWYAVFTAAPNTTDVIDQSTLAGLDSIVKLDNGHLVFARADENGNMTIINDGSFLAAAGLTAPVQLWFAPVTIHNTEAMQPDEFFENEDACIHINSESAFTITYLSELDFTIEDPGATSGSLTVSGGFPEWDNTGEYSVTLTDLSTNAVIELTSDDNSVFNYTIPSPDHSYRVTIADNVGCSSSRIINFLSGEPLEVHVPDTTATQGSEICIPLTVKDFRDIATFNFVMRWNPGILEFSSIGYENPALSVDGNNLTENDGFTDQGNLLVLWLAENFIPIGIPNDSVLMEVCFTAVGDPGQRTDVTLGSYNGTPIGFSTLDSSKNFSIFPGSVTIVPSDSLDFTYSALCSGSDNLTVQIFGGRGPYSYSLNGDSNAQGDGESNRFEIPDLEPGNYTLEITDASGAMVSKNITIMNNEVPYGISPQPNTCTSDPNGMAWLTNPPAGNYQIEWTYNNETFYNIDTLKNIAGGEVTYRILDENNCQNPVGRGTIPNLGVRADYDVLQGPTCEGGAGSVRIDITGGTAPYTVYHSGTASPTSSSIDLPIYRENESFNISDANGCAVALAVTSSIDGGETFTLNDSTVIDINCENVEDGGNGRLGQFEGTVSNSSNTTNENFTDAVLYHADGTLVHGTKSMNNPLTGSIRARFLDAGDYYWNIIGECADSNFYFKIENFASNPPTIDPTITPIGCDSPDGQGTISLEVFPDNDGYTFDWSHGASTAEVNDLDEGEYTVTVTDPETTCSVTETYTISPGVVFTKIETTLPCDVDTMVNVGVTIRDEFESILWDSGENTELISVNAPGYYGFTITPTDPECSAFRDSIYIRTQAGDVRIDDVDFPPVKGCDEPEGIIIVYLNDNQENYSFSWDNSAPVVGLNDYRVFDDELHNLKIYKDDCVAIDTNLRFDFPNLISLDTSVFNITCYGENDGQINVQATGGGSNNFRYEFNNTGREDFFAEYTDLTPGTYNVRVIDQTPPAASPCPDLNLTFTITEPEPFTVGVDTTQVSPPLCTGNSDGSILLVMMGGNPGTKDIRYNYSGGAGQTNELMLDSLRASLYQIRVEDSLGCVATTEYVLEDPDPVNFAIPPIEEPSCAGYTTTLTISNATGGTGADYQYSVDGGVPVPLGEPIDILAGNHDITVFDGNLCSVNNVVPIREPAPITVDFNQPDTIQVSLGENTEIAAQVNGENPIDDYIWSPAPPDSLNIENILAFTAVDNVTINLEVIDSRGCVGSNQIFVLVRKKRDVGIPNAFSPNGDGHNDLLTIIPGPSVRSIQQFQVYDRYGTLMFEESDISPAEAQITGWDGTYSGKPAMFDVYVTLVKVEYIDGEVIQRVTDVTLLK